MTKLQSYFEHSGDCSCYQIIFDKNGIAHDCDICDCGALRNTMRRYLQKNDETDKIIYECWVEHLEAITNQKNK